VNRFGIRPVQRPYDLVVEAPPVGFEPTHTAPEAVALSPELWGLSVRRTLRPHPQSEASHRAPNGRSNTTSAPHHRGTRRARDGPPQTRDGPPQTRDATGRHRSPTNTSHGRADRHATGTPRRARNTWPRARHRPARNTTPQTPRGEHIATGTRPTRDEHATGARGNTLPRTPVPDAGRACHRHAADTRETRSPTGGGQATELRALRGLERITSRG
jgi:hypothetical protein